MNALMHEYPKCIMCGKDSKIWVQSLYAPIKTLEDYKKYTVYFCGKDCEYDIYIDDLDLKIDYIGKEPTLKR